MNPRGRYILFSCILALAFILSSCRGVSDINVPPEPQAVQAPVTKRIFLVLMENQKFEAIVGNPNAPYINSLIARGGLATNFEADTHPSLGNYFMLTVGNIITNDLFFADVVGDDNLIRELGQHGIGWRAYLQSIPETGYLGDNAYPYVKSHNPFAYFSDTHFYTSQANNMVSLDQFAADLANGNLPAFVYLTPDQMHNMHDCLDGTGNGCTNNDKIKLGDDWLRTNIEPILESPDFQKNGILILTWDESWDNDDRGGGGRVPTIFVGPGMKQGFKSTTFYQHESTLRFIEEQLGLPVTLGKSVDAPSMAEFLTGN
jgi:acid phosphatase